MSLFQGQNKNSMNIKNISFYWNRIHIFKVNVKVNAEAHSQICVATTAVYYRHSHRRHTQHPPANTLFSKATMICSPLLQIPLFWARTTGITHHVDFVTNFFHLAQCSQLSKLWQVSGLNPFCAHRIVVPHFLNPVVCEWAFGLFSPFGYEQVFCFFSGVVISNI